MSSNLKNTKKITPKSGAGWLEWTREDFSPSFAIGRHQPPPLRAERSPFGVVPPCKSNAFGKMKFCIRWGIKKTKKSLRRVILVGLSGLEPPTPTLSGWCSNRLSYKPSNIQITGGDKPIIKCFFIITSKSKSVKYFNKIFCQAKFVFYLHIFLLTNFVEICYHNFIKKGCLWKNFCTF